MSNIRLVDVSEANCITHAGVFHADDVLSTVFLSKLLPEVKLARVTHVPEGISDDVIVFDIGGGKFDHHQRDFSKSRVNGIKYSSFGLLWKEYGLSYLEEYDNHHYIFYLFDELFIEAIDATDNGQIQNNNSLRCMTISNIVSLFNPEWDEVSSSNHRFMQAIEYSELIFNKSLKHCISVAKAKSHIERAIRNSTSPIMVLEQTMPWQEHLLTSDHHKAQDILYVIFPSARGGWNIQAVPDMLGGFGQRKPLPEKWAGLRGEKLAEVCRIPEAIFCHPARFICGASTLESAIKMAEKAIQE